MVSVDYAIDRIMKRLDSLETCIRRIERELATHTAASDQRLRDIAQYQKTSRERIAMAIAAVASAAAVIAVVV